MQPEVQVGSLMETNIVTGSAVLDENPKHLSKFLTFKNATIQASNVSQFRLMPPTPNGSQSKNKYPIELCKKFMKEVSAAGFGTVKEVQKSGSLRKALTFRKRPFGELENAQLETLKRLRIDEESYSASQTSSSSTSDDLSFFSTASDSDDTVPPNTLSTPDSQRSQT